MSDNDNRGATGQPPVSAHPVFPVIVALWFAALLGIGSMVLPIELFERFAVASGLADAYQAAQPPLGATARIVVALAAGVIGGAAGILIARRIAASTPQPASRRAAGLRKAGASDSPSAKRPISALEELGEGGLDAGDDLPALRATRPSRRRGLAVSEESARSEFLSFAPLPGQSTDHEDEPLDLMSFEAPVPAAPEELPAAEEPVPAAIQEAVFGSAALSGLPSPSSLPVSAMPDAASPAPFERRRAPEAPEPSAPPAVLRGVPVAERALGELGMVELVERFALALQRHRDAAATEDAFAEVAADTETAPIAEPETAPATGIHLVAEDAPPQFSEMPAALRPFGFDPLPSEEDEEADDLPDLDLDLDLDLAAALATRGPLAAKRSALPDEEPETDEDESSTEADYPSLLAMKNPLGQHREAVRIDDFDGEDEGEEPVVVFPGQALRRAAPVGDEPVHESGPVHPAPVTPRPFDSPLERAERIAATGQNAPATAPARRPADPGATERALRDALEKLQRMSGAA